MVIKGMNFRVHQTQVQISATSFTSYMILSLSIYVKLGMNKVYVSQWLSSLSVITDVMSFEFKRQLLGLFQYPWEKRAVPQKSSQLPKNVYIISNVYIYSPLPTRFPG